MSQRLISNRKQVAYIPVDAVVRNLRSLKKYNIKTWYNSFDPSRDKDYFINLFRRIRKNKIKLGLQFECLHIPDEEFIAEAEKTFSPVRFICSWE